MSAPASIESALAVAKPGLIHDKLASVLADVDSISKDRTNAGQGFKFRGIDDVYRELHKVFARHRIYCTPDVMDQRHEERTSAKGNIQLWTVVKMQYTFYTTDGSCVSASVLGEAIDQADKSAGKAQSYAHKVCLLQMFCIPTESDEDPDAHSPKLGQRGRPQGQPPKSAPVQPPADPTNASAPAAPADEVYRETDEQKRTLAGHIKATFAAAGKQAPSGEAFRALALRVSKDAAADKVPMAKIESAVRALLAGDLAKAQPVGGAQ